MRRVPKFGEVWRLDGIETVASNVMSDDGHRVMVEPSGRTWLFVEPNDWTFVREASHETKKSYTIVEDPNV